MGQIEEINEDDECITSNVEVPFDNSDKIKYPTPFENIMTLYDQIVKMQEKKKPLLQQLNLLTDSDTFTEKLVDEMEKLEEEVDFITKYSKTLEDQLVVIMNEHDVKGIPSLPLLSMNPMNPLLK